MNRDRLHVLQSRMYYRLLLNLLFAVIVTFFFVPNNRVLSYILSFVVGAGVLVILDRRYSSYLYWSLAFVFYLLWDILKSNLAMVWLVLKPRPNMDPGIVAIPLTVNTGLEIIVLATAISLGPGTLSIDLRHTAKGQRVLYVHALQVGDPEQFRTSIKRGFERRILRISRGVAE